MSLQNGLHFLMVGGAKRRWWRLAERCYCRRRYSSQWRSGTVLLLQLTVQVLVMVGLNRHGWSPTGAVKSAIRTKTHDIKIWGFFFYLNWSLSNIYIFNKCKYEVLTYGQRCSNFIFYLLMLRNLPWGTQETYISSTSGKSYLCVFRFTLYCRLKYKFAVFDLCRLYKHWFPVQNFWLSVRHSTRFIQYGVG